MVATKSAVFFFGALALSHVLEHVHDAQFLAGSVGEGGIGRQKIAREPRVGFIALAGNAFAVRTLIVAGFFAGERITNAAAHHGAVVAVEQVAKALVYTEDSSGAVVHQDRVADGIESIRPLLLCRGHLFE